ncbi:hypothetical protein DICVIV_12703 [Dictyocaulus viviparus]|uniref:Uncharacterized protein n=1 Tax=Dictyocaulus viviparus TaxID=29172 RepID=A0A0D8X9T9_DICVI|nr:hypothetical protein DICVIV_12703 [Dictyocaulus viviparus]
MCEWFTHYFLHICIILFLCDNCESFELIHTTPTGVVFVPFWFVFICLGIVGAIIFGLLFIRHKLYDCSHKATCNYTWHTWTPRLRTTRQLQHYRFGMDSC